MSDSMLKTEYRKTVDLELLYHNPRTIDKQDFDRLCASLRSNPKFFEARPIILSDRTGLMVVIAGNQRLRAALEIGMTEVPTVLIPGLSEKEEKEIIIRDNVSNGKWDWDMLANEWDEVQLDEWGVEFPFYDLDEPEDSEEQNEKSASGLSKITIELSDESIKDALKFDILKVLENYPQASLK